MSELNIRALARKLIYDASASQCTSHYFNFRDRARSALNLKLTHNPQGSNKFYKYYLHTHHKEFTVYLIRQAHAPATSHKKTYVGVCISSLTLGSAAPLPRSPLACGGLYVHAAVYVKNLLDSCLRFLRCLQFESGHLRGPLMSDASQLLPFV